MPLDPLATGQPLEQGTIEAASGVMIDVLGGGLLAPAGEPQPGSQALGIALQRLAIDQQGEAVLEPEFGALRLAPLFFEGACHADEAEFAEAVTGGVGEHWGLLNGSSHRRGCSRARRAARQAPVPGAADGRGRGAGLTAPS